MSSMYVVPPLVPMDLDVHPVNRMYYLPNIHNIKAEKDLVNGDCSLDDSHNPIKDIKDKQYELMQSLLLLQSSLDTLLKKVEEPTSPVNKNKLDMSISTSTTAPPEGSKKDKEAKKDARKAAKMEAKSKVASSNTAKKSAELASNDRRWTLIEKKQAAETEQSLTACLPQKFSKYRIEKLGDVSLIITVTDHTWVNALSVFGEKRSVAFKGFVHNACKGASTTITVSEGDSFCAISSGCSLNCRLSAWKLFGSAMGVFSFDKMHSVQAAYQHKWLSQIDLLLDGKITKDEVIREANRFLAQFDALGSQFEFGIVDVIAKSVLVDSCYDSPLPNNVELWSKRLESVM